MGFWDPRMLQPGVLETGVVWDMDISLVNGNVALVFVIVIVIVAVRRKSSQIAHLCIHI